MKSLLRIGTRGSRLALWQANWVKDQIKAYHKNITVELIPIKTRGDKILDVPLAKVGGKGLFVKEIEDALLKDEIDLAVHSMKDVPTDLPSGLIIGAITRREDIRDALVSRKGKPLTELPAGAGVGTSSLRRGAQIKHYRPDVEIVPIRGNLETRLKKIESLDISAVVVAAAGMHRLGLSALITEYLSFDLCLPAIGQGAIGIEWREDDRETESMLSFLNHLPTAQAVQSERAFLKVLEGGCQVPIACMGQVEGEEILLEGMVADIAGTRLIRGSLKGPVFEGERLGGELARALLSRGALEILKEVYGRDDYGKKGR